MKYFSHYILTSNTRKWHR